MSADLMQATNLLFDAAFKSIERRPTRQERLEGIQGDILKFNPSLDQGMEIISSVLQSWAEEYPAHKLVVVEEEARALKVAVEEAQSEPNEVDAAMAADKDWV